MDEELKKEKIKRAALALTDLLKSGIYDYFHGIHGSNKMVKTDRYGFDKYDIEDLLSGMNSYLSK